MRQNSSSFSKFLLAVLFPLAGFLTLSQPAISQGRSSSSSSAIMSYRPPNRGTPTRGIRGSGSRGCPVAEAMDQSSNSQDMMIALLVPDNHVGQTLSAQPTLFWFVSAPPEQTLEITLVEPKVAQPLLTQQVKVDRGGLMKLEIQPGQVELEAGKRYRWSVAIVCNPNRRSTDVLAQGWIERVSDVAALTPEEAGLPAQDRAKLYAERGLWYDALREIASAYDIDPQNSLVQQELKGLLNQVGLDRVAGRLPE